MRNIDRIENIKNSHPFKLWDLSVYALVIFAAVMLLIAASKPQGDAVRIKYFDANGKAASRTVPLEKDNEIELPLADGAHYKIIIKDGKVWAKESDCRDKVCLGMGKISRVGQQIVCLPQRITVTVIGSGETEIYV